ncbi:nucleoside 2-deoxyribosyltransferase [uncultured Azohydromonas sp.]|jgi:Nucleoside 2-deoxyribosyltransferase|uniref:nucleoside 2-deoxyribosyltransferase n=1 Tax=uncultured Azohydromonas sp. TaxID=487342 RepID=UPI0026033666|nr:nucleoside 2-deoxyribosyltransferase [uncultured Azohydromonas sp.]
MKKIYLAGPDVFFRDATARYDRLRALCSHYGMRAVAPVDGNEPPAGLDKTAQAEWIYQGNMAHLRGCDAVLANVMAFRNPVEPDSGTVFEIGVAVALGKPVAAYDPELRRGTAERVQAAFGRVPGPPGQLFDAMHGYLIEDFDQPLNLMLARSCSLHTRVEEAVSTLAQMLGVSRH